MLCSAIIGFKKFTLQYMNIKTNEVCVKIKNAFKKYALEYIFMMVYVCLLSRVLSMDSLNIKRLCGWHEHQWSIHYLQESTGKRNLIVFLARGCVIFTKMTYVISFTGPPQWCSRFFKQTDKYIFIHPLALKLSTATYDVLLMCRNPINTLNFHLTCILYLDYIHLNSHPRHTHKWQHYSIS